MTLDWLIFSGICFVLSYVGPKQHENRWFWLGIAGGFVQLAFVVISIMHGLLS